MLTVPFALITGGSAGGIFCEIIHLHRNNTPGLKKASYYPVILPAIPACHFCFSSNVVTIFQPLSTFYFSQRLPKLQLKLSQLDLRIKDFAR